MHTDYLNPAIRQLRDQQVRFTPRERKIEQAAQAERLLGELDPAHVSLRIHLLSRDELPPGVVSRLEAQRRGGQPRLAAVRRGRVGRGRGAGGGGRRAGDDRRGAGQHVQRFDEDDLALAAPGLVSRRFVIDGRKRVGFLQSSVDRFVDRNRERVSRGSQFSQLSDEERELIIERARRLARAGGSPAEVTKRLARKTGRSAETIRYTLKQFDHDHPEAAVFPDNHGPLQSEAKRKIYQQYQRGESVEALAKRFCRTRTSIYRIIAEVRAAARSRSCRWTSFANDAFSPGPIAEARRPRSGGHARGGIADEEGRGCPAACRPIWPACTRCRC